MNLFNLSRCVYYPHRLFDILELFRNLEFHLRFFLQINFLIYWKQGKNLPTGFGGLTHKKMKKPRRIKKSNNKNLSKIILNYLRGL